jgi:hypothetical protein|tara:strand:+ start:527 stop:757 length:231 start_codon:yes stop_codon:yes gene_type:complete
MNDYETLEQLVARINGPTAPKAEASASTYAYESAKEAGHGIGDPELKAHLSVLSEAGAVFDYKQALKYAQNKRAFK